MQKRTRVLNRVTGKVHSFHSDVMTRFRPRPRLAQQLRTATGHIAQDQTFAECEPHTYSYKVFTRYGDIKMVLFLKKLPLHK